MTDEQKRLQNKLNQRKYRHKKLLGYVPKSGGRRGRPREPGTYRNQPCGVSTELEQHRHSASAGTDCELRVDAAAAVAHSAPVTGTSLEACAPSLRAPDERSVDAAKAQPAEHAYVDYHETRLQSAGSSVDTGPSSTMVESAYPAFAAGLPFDCTASHARADESVHEPAPAAAAPLLDFAACPALEPRPEMQQGCDPFLPSVVSAECSVSSLPMPQHSSSGSSVVRNPHTLHPASSVCPAEPLHPANPLYPAEPSRPADPLYLANTLQPSDYHCSSAASRAAAPRYPPLAPSPLAACCPLPALSPDSAYSSDSPQSSGPPTPIHALFEEHRWQQPANTCWPRPWVSKGSANRPSPQSELHGDVGRVQLSGE
ncbi:hypothetical protein E8E11_000675 [Didymella keratinophila]|nr:hypothetical protein E8E11_000675 [Didymella keratinophila]